MLLYQMIHKYSNDNIVTKNALKWAGAPGIPGK